MPDQDQRKELSLQLKAIQGLLQDLLVIEGAQAGMSKEQVRQMLGVRAERVSRIWQHLKLDVSKQSVSPPSPSARPARVATRSRRRHA